VNAVPTFLPLASTVTPQPVPTNLFSNSSAVALIALLHLQIAAFIQGASFLLVVSESLSLVRGDERHERLANTLLKGMVWVFALGAALAILWVTWILLGMWGTFFIALTRITFWAFIFEAGLFITEIVVLYTLYANWDRLRAYRRARLGLAVLLSITLWWQQFFIDVVASYMLTPNGGDTNQLNQILNPTNLPLTVHRTVGNIAWAGAILGGIAAVRYLRARRRERGELRIVEAPARSVGAMAVTWFPEDARTQSRPAVARTDTSFWDWAGTWGAVWAIAATILQPWIGYSYAKEIQLHAYPAWYRMMFGDLSDVFLVQITLLGLIFILGNVFFWRRMRASETRGQRTQVLMLVVLVLATLLAATPARFANTVGEIGAGQLKPWWDGGLLNPIGTMIPNKIIALLALMFCGLVSVTGFLRAHSRGELRWGDASRRSQWLLVGLTLTVSSMMIVMGVIREHSRQPFVINGEMTIQGQQVVNPPPSPTPTGSSP
jgi:cytochrome bd ubiquinol oxidase subunit I